MKFRSLIVVAATIALTGFGCSQAPVPGPTPTPTSSLSQTYTDTSGRFSFGYAADMKPVTDSGLLEPYHVLPDVAVGMTSNVSSYHPMNYNQDTWFVVSTQSTDEATCYAAINTGTSTELAGRQTLNGREFRVARTSDAGAGNRYEMTVYRTFAAGTCYEIATTLHSASDWTNVDQAAITQSQQTATHLLDDMAASFRLL